MKNVLFTLLCISVGISSLNAQVPVNIFAGGGATLGDGGPATAAQLGGTQGICSDGNGNVYVLEQGSNARVRKISPTGIITTVAGYGVGGFSGDGGPATAAQFDAYGLSCDGNGNLYIGDWNNNRVRRVDAITGIITTVAGNGSYTTSGDGGPATAAGIKRPIGATMDNFGNLYICEYGAAKIRKVDALTGIITTFATGISSPCQIATDVNGNVYVGSQAGYIYKISPSGISAIVAGGGVGTASNVPATSIALLGPEGVAVDADGNIFIADNNHSLIRKVDPAGIITTLASHSNQWVGLDVSGNLYITDGAGYVYKMDSVSAGIGFDSYTSLPVQFYIDVDSNCSFNPPDYYLSIPRSVAIDSNGITIDTLSVTSGIYYRPKGGPGTIYGFSFIHDTTWATCPVSGKVYDTLTSYVGTYPTKYIAVKPTSTLFDLSVNPVIPVTGRNDQWGHIYVQNSLGLPLNGTVKLSFDPRWYLTAESHPMPTIVGDTAIWTISLVSPISATPTDIYYVLRNVAAQLPIGDVVEGDFSVTPSAGDHDPVNNFVIKHDTVKSGCDPNYIENMPSGCLPYSAGAHQLQYTVHFENTGNDTAHDIYVLDTLSPYLDIHTFKLKLASAPMNISYINSNGVNIIKFDFPKINLPDSSHHGLCDAAVIYTISSLPALPDSTIIENKAGIYFDVNPVVPTNIAQNKIGCPLLIKNIAPAAAFELYPNPVSDELTIVADNSVYKSYVITNALGQVLKQQAITQSETSVNTHSLTPGLYYIRLIQENGDSRTEKFLRK